MNDEIFKLEKKLLSTYNIKGIKLCGAGGGGYFLVFSKDNIKEGKLIFTDLDKASRACNLFNKLYGKKWTTIGYGVLCDVYYRGTPDYFPKHRPCYS